MHDRHGNPLALGDAVVIRGTLTALFGTEHGDENPYCNVTVTTAVPMAGTPYTITLNAKQTELEVPPQPSAPISADDALPWDALKIEDTAP